MSPPDPRETPLNAVRVETTVEADGEMHLTHLPCQRGDKTECVQGRSGVRCTSVIQEINP
jgi:hypothetical protein